MRTADIRESFLAFFESKGCIRQPSASLIPEDPSLLLTVAGMVPFKPVFLGVKKLDFTRAVTAQKCVRTNDIDIIGTTGRHLSFFEMLGNFSFGDYFKREAITWAWEYSTEILALDPQRLWVSVFTDDDEAADLWIECTDIAPERVVRLGAEDNFWAAGPTGPCGPCSELYYDRGEEFSCGPDCRVGCDCDRFVEYWNLVFMQYDRDQSGALTPLVNQNIDTGLGLERMAAILQDVPSNYEIDLMQDIMALASEITNTRYGSAEKTDIALRIITDHCRAVTFLIADGVLPSNEGRGYVLRRLLRRAIRYGRLLGVQTPFMVRMVDKVIECMQDAYPELMAHHELISSIVGAEEERFDATLRTGLAYLDSELSGLDAGSTLSGIVAFTLHDTYGFPYDLTVEIAGEQGIAVDSEGFATQMEKQKTRARAHVKDKSWDLVGGVYADLEHEFGKTDFVGYALDCTEAVVQALVSDGARVETLATGQEGEVLLDTTTAYGEQGGQVGDRATISTVEGAEFIVQDTKISEKTQHLHRGMVQQGRLHVGDRVTVATDVARRQRVSRNHTATHLLHWALRQVLGTHVAQAGSAVAPDRFRFDFTHFEALTRSQIDEVERLVNTRIFRNAPVRAYETSLETAREQGVTALFGEKYGEFVRVLEIGSFSKELCGGTHVGRTAEIGFFKIVGESSVGANVRRIEAVTSFDAYDYIGRHEQALREAATVLRSPLAEVGSRVSALSTKLKEAEARLKQMQSAPPVSGSLSFENTIYEVNGYKVAFDQPCDLTAADLKPRWDMIRKQGIDAVVIIGLDCVTHKAIFMAAGNDAAVTRGFDACAIVKTFATALGGRGGGKPAMAQGGADKDGDLDRALVLVREMLGVEP